MSLASKIEEGRAKECSRPLGHRKGKNKLDFPYIHFLLNKLAQIQWFKITQIYYFTILEVRNLKWVIRAKFKV
jgi:hypothetical protein